MDNKEFGKELEQRTKQFAISVIRFSSSLPSTVEGRILRNQLSKAGTSVGANYREANRARSKADFSNKIKISEGEASEAVYWLGIIKEFDWNEKNIIDQILNEAKEILAIFSSISKSLSQN